MTNNNGNILVVDDNRMNRLKLSRGVQQHGYTVDVAESGSQAFEKLQGMVFNLILLDTTMPDPDGYQILQQLKTSEQFKQIPVIMLSALPDSSDMNKYLSQGAADYLPANFDAATLKHCLDTYIHHRIEEDDSGKIAILVVDDDEMNRLKLSYSLKKADFAVKLAENGEQALEIVQQKAFDLILLDVMMPGIDGFETCRRLKMGRTTREIPVLFMTALTDTEDKLKGFEVGAVDYITKPIHPEEVLARVNTHLRIRGLTQSLEEAYGQEQKRRQLSDTLRQVAKIVSSTLDQDEVLNLILDQLERVVTYHRASITLLFENKLIVAAGRNKMGTVVKGFTIPVDQYPLNATALQEKQPILVADVKTDPRWQGVKHDVAIRSFINAPLLVQNRPIGLLGVSRSDEVPYTNEDAQTVFAFAIQVAIAAENARLVQQTKISLYETEGLFKGARAILGSTDLHEICQILTSQFKYLVQADRVVIYLIDTQQKAISLTMNNGELSVDDAYMSYEELLQGLSGKVIETGQPILSLSAYDGQESAETAQRRIKSGTGSIIVLPLITREKVIGTVTALNRFEQRLFTTHDVDLLMALANQAATAIENVRLYNLAQAELIERKKAEQALQQANVELKKLNADKDKFFSIVAHDLRGPFMPLIGYAQLLTQTAGELSTTEIKEMTSSMYRSTRRVLDLLDNLLEWARLQMGRMDYNPEEVLLKDLILRNIDLLGATATYKNITLHTAFENTLFVYADAYMTDTVLRNLISNALKFTPAEGQITVRAKLNAITEWVEISVSDTGVGISSEDLNKLFKLDVHYTTYGTAQEQGTGLGLIMCQEMINKNGGNIWVESEEGKGTTFTFTLPRYPQQIATAEASKSSAESVLSTAEIIHSSYHSEFIVPPPIELATLLESAEKGHIPVIKQQLMALAEQNNLYQPFTEQLLELANQFEDEKLITLLREHLTVL